MASYEINDWTAFLKERLQSAKTQSKMFPTASLPSEEIHIVVDKTEDLTATAGGFSAQILRLHVSTVALSPEEPVYRTTCIVKRTKPEAIASSVSLGISREADFFSYYAPLVDPDLHFLPTIFFSAVEGSGYKVVIMEDLTLRNGVQSGYFFGDHSIINHGKDLATLTRHFVDKGVSEKDIVLRAFDAAARLHGRFWMSETLLAAEHGLFLRASGWIQGKDEASFKAIAGWAIAAWSAFLDKNATSDPPIVAMDPRVKALVDCAASQVDFAAYEKLWRSPTPGAVSGGLPWTLVHGDFHPANMMVVDAQNPQQEGHKFDLTLLDFEAVGVGSGPQDLGQYMISHSRPELRRQYEAAALSAYTSTLNEVIQINQPGVPRVSIEDITKEYVEGGLCRWAWLFPVCCSVCPPSALQYFHDQMLSFMTDHSVEPTSVGMMRP
mmetsp:Transcript_60852/g.70644  ORF Transcript_60852/g.70644 Transcript_60852/m.70644 type:complete len:438 (+) Transcript_60852:74-1387(+)|eukprot:CAMPEP_0176425886 /NCGR_PEP_ID=MMETSP0127-20121128/11634_1 /TAXON_ID=938130 /ORGANISM="Platyophrya macrostoma, Strain WH" /LENGTH=437 /DNA_ID=CAMNT_0017807089 /DNA_START=118 /DNA_END=1431 /DNA_ORIENTATION=+